MEAESDTASAFGKTPGDGLTEDVQHRVFAEHDQISHHHVTHQLLKL